MITLFCDIIYSADQKIQILNNFRQLAEKKTKYSDKRCRMKMFT